MTVLEEVLRQFAVCCTSASWRTFVDRSSMFQRGECPAVNIRRRTAQNTNRPQRAIDSLFHALSVDVDIYTRLGEVGPQAVDEIDAQIHAAIMADPTLNHTARGCFRIGTDWDVADGDASPARATIRYEIHYATRANDIRVAA